jgi:hypothetical protein
MDRSGDVGLGTAGSAATGKVRCEQARLGPAGGATLDQVCSEKDGLAGVVGAVRKVRFVLVR